MTSKPSEYSLFIKQSDIDNVIQSSNDDKSTTYIILQNNELHSKFIAISQELGELRNENDELEEYNGKLEKSKAHIQGITKNQYLISQEKSKEINFYKESYQYIWTNCLYSYALHIPYNFLLMFSIFSFKVKFAIFLVTYSYYTNKCIEIYKFRKDFLNGKKITDIKEELQSLDKSNDHLHELIDNF